MFTPMMKKLIVIISGAILLNTVMMVLPIIDIANADDQATAPPATVKDVSKMEFDVTKNLKLNGSGQSASYFKGAGQGGTQMSPIVSLILSIIEFATKIMGSIAVILYIVSGFMYMVSQGNQQDLDKAKNIFKYTTIGLVVAFSSYLITLFVQSIFYPTVS